MARAEPTKKMVSGATKAKYITEEELDSIFTAVNEGTPIRTACLEVGTSVTQFKMRAGREPELAKRLAEVQEIGKKAQAEILRDVLWRHVLEGNFKAAEKMAYVMLPDWRELLTHRVEVGNMDGEAFVMAALQQLGDASIEDVEKMIEILERNRAPLAEVRALPSAVEEG
jgi:hypothetical protein